MEISAESAVECKVEEGPGIAEEEKGMGVTSGAVAGGGVASCEELDLDQVKGRMLTMAGLFEIWKNDLEVLK